MAEGQLGIFTNGYWGHPAMKLPPEVNLLARRPLPPGARHPAQGEPGRGHPRRQDARTSRTSPWAASRTPSTSTALPTLNMEKLYRIKDLLEEVRTFVHQVYLPGRLRDRRHVPGVAGLRRRRDQLPRRARPPARRQGRRGSTCPAARSSTATSRPCSPFTALQRSVLPRQRDRVRRPLLVRGRLDPRTRSTEETVPKYAELEDATASTPG